MIVTRVRTWIEPLIESGRGFDIAFAAACVVAYAALMYLSSGLTFFADEWALIGRAHEWSLDELMRPHNEHWSLGLKLVYKPLMAAVGLTTYVPYMAITLLLHVATAVALYAYARHQTTPLIAFAIGCVFLVLGTAGENLFWAMQIGFNGATAAGAWALVILMREPQPRHGWLAALLLLVSVTFSGIGLFFLAAAGAIIVVAPRLRRWWWVLVPATLAYAAWYLMYGRGALGAPSQLRELVEFTQVGIANAVGQLSGLGSEIGLVIAILIAIVAVADVVRGGSRRLGLIAGAVGLLVQFILIGLSRAGGGAILSTAPRYVHPAAVFILMAVIGWLGHRELRMAEHRPRLIVFVGLTAVALAWNLAWVVSQSTLNRDRAGETRAAISLLTRYGGTPAIPAHRGLVRQAEHGGQLGFAAPGQEPLIPGSDRLRSMLARWGSPVEDSLAVRPVAVPDRVVDRVFARLAGDSLSVTSAMLPVDPASITLSSAGAVTIRPDGACLRLEPSGSDPSVRLVAPSGSSLYLTAPGTGRGEVFVSLRGTFQDAGIAYEAAPGEALRIALPDIGQHETIQVRIDIPPGGPTRMCMRPRDPAAGAPGSVDVDELTIEAAAGRPLPPADRRPQVEFSNSVAIDDAAPGCISVGAIGPDPHLSLIVPDEHALHVAAAEGGPAQVFVDFGTGYAEAQSVHLTMTREPVTIHMPPGSDPVGWAIRLDPPDDQVTTVCLGRLTPAD